MPGFHRLQPSYDLLVIGGGHAGLQAGLKAGLLHHTALVIDRGTRYSRSYYAPRMDNIPGVPDGISGHKLLDLQVAALKGVEGRVGLVAPAHATVARRTGAGFEVEFDWMAGHHVVRGKGLILAMGVVDRIPEVGGKIDTIFPWANMGLVHFCLFCDGHDLESRKVAVLGHTPFAVRTALDLAHFSPQSLELLTLGRPLLEGVDEAERAELTKAMTASGISHFDEAIVGFDGIREKKFDVRFADGSVRNYDRGFSGLGWWEMNQAIPRSLGCSFDAEGYVVTDEDCRAMAEDGSGILPGLYCIGDQRNGWNQIPEAWATAERAVIHAYAYYL